MTLSWAWKRRIANASAFIFYGTFSLIFAAQVLRPAISGIHRLSAYLAVTPWFIVIVFGLMAVFAVLPVKYPYRLLTWVPLVEYSMVNSFLMFQQTHDWLGVAGVAAFLFWMLWTVIVSQVNLHDNERLRCELKNMRQEIHYLQSIIDDNQRMLNGALQQSEPIGRE